MLQNKTQHDFCYKWIIDEHSYLSGRSGWCSTEDSQVRSSAYRSDNEKDSSNCEQQCCTTNFQCDLDPCDVSVAGTWSSSFATQWAVNHTPGEGRDGKDWSYVVSKNQDLPVFRGGNSCEACVPVSVLCLSRRLVFTGICFITACTMIFVDTESKLVALLLHCIVAGSPGMCRTAANTVCSDWLLPRSRDWNWCWVCFFWCSCSEQLKHSPVYYEQHWWHWSQVQFISAACAVLYFITLIFYPSARYNFCNFLDTVYG